MVLFYISKGFDHKNYVREIITYIQAQAHAYTGGPHFFHLGGFLKCQMQTEYL